MIHAHQTAPTQFVEANGIRFAYRRFGKAGGVPIVFNQHYTGTMDYWGPGYVGTSMEGRNASLRIGNHENGYNPFSPFGFDFEYSAP
jgi:hypothetical protein